MRNFLCLVLAFSVGGVVPAAGQPVELGTPDEALRRLFTPETAPPGTYQVLRSSESVETLADRLKALDARPAPGAWLPRRLEIGAVFGQEGPHDRGRLARLFKGQRVTVVRGALHLDGRRRAFMLVSPYPDASLSRIVDGTMTIVIDLSP